MPTQLLSGPEAGVSAIPSNALAVSYLLALRSAMDDDDLDRALAPYGIYTQRQRGLYLLRIKVPNGLLSAAQLRRLADAVAVHGVARLHLTTRQDVELHSLTADDLTGLLDRLAEIGMSGSESGGNTVRNVTICPLAGICPAEAFDVRPYAALLDRKFRGLGIVSVLPRKFKIALSGCGRDCAHAMVHDLGLVALDRDTAGEQAPGFRVDVGGGLGALPRAATTLCERLPAGALLPMAEALLRVFQLYSEFEHRERSRLKFLVERVGIEQIREWLAAEMGAGGLALAASGSLAPARDGRSPVDDPFALSEASAPDDPFGRWLRANVVGQRQAERFAVFMVLSGGDLTIAQWRGLADLCDGLGLGGLRLTVQQQAIIPDVAGHHVEKVYERLLTLGLTGLGGRAGISACPGSCLCRRAITSSLDLAVQLGQLLPASWQADPVFADTRIHISGCPNSCARPQLATIGLIGCASHAQGRLYPAYRLYLRGEGTDEQATLGRFVVRLPARRVPEALRRLIALHAAKVPGETFARFVGRLDGAAAQSTLADLARAPDATAADCFVDWGSEQAFTLS